MSADTSAYERWLEGREDLDRDDDHWDEFRDAVKELTVDDGYESKLAPERW